MAELALDIRHRYLETTLTRTAEWLADEGIKQILGKASLEMIDLMIARMYVPNLTAGRRYIKASTPAQYRDTDMIPVFTGFPGDRLIPDGPMMRQTSNQRDTTVTQFAGMYDDVEKARQVVHSYDARLARVGNATTLLYVTRYDADGATQMSSKVFGPSPRTRRLLGRPTLTLTMADMEDGYTLASPGTFIHELFHIQDHESAGSVAEDSLRAYTISTEFRAHHMGSKLESYARAHGLTRGDELADYNRQPRQPTYSDRFERVRLACNGADDPFAYSAAADALLVKARLMKPARDAQRKVDQVPQK